MDSLKREIYEKVSEWESQRQGVSRIHEKLCRNMQREVPLDLIKEILNEIRSARKGSKGIESLTATKAAEKKDGGLNKLNAAEEAPSYEITEEYYIFKKEGRSFPVLISTVRAIFECYSKYGKDMSSEEIRQQFKLKPGIFELIKNAVGLYKSSHVDDPVTLSRLSEKELDEHVDGKVDRIIEDKYITKYRRSVEEKKSRDLRKYALSNKGYDIFLEKLENVIKNIEPIDFSDILREDIENNDTKQIFLTDSHFGQKGTNGIISRFHRLTQDLVNTPEKNIEIVFGGDLGEQFVPYGEKHPGMRLGMEDMTVEDLIMLIVSVFKEMLVTLYKAGKNVTFNGMSGNHDHLSENKDFDPHRTPAMIIFRFLQSIVEDTSIKINILRDKVNVIRSNGVKYVYHHGDGLSPAQLNRIALEQIEDGMYLVIVSGDKHHFACKEISDRVLRVQSPAICGPGRYDKGLNLSSLPGVVEFQQNIEGMVDVIIKRYK